MGETGFCPISASRKVNHDDNHPNTPETTHQADNVLLQVTPPAGPWVMNLERLDCPHTTPDANTMAKIIWQCTHTARKSGTTAPSLDATSTPFRFDTKPCNPYRMLPMGPTTLGQQVSGQPQSSLKDHGFKRAPRKTRDELITSPRHMDRHYKAHKKKKSPCNIAGLATFH